jgi:hypothetical protein
MESRNIGFLNNFNLCRSASSAKSSASGSTGKIVSGNWGQTSESVEGLVRSFVKFGLARGGSDESEVVGTRSKVSVPNEMFRMVSLVPNDDVCLVTYLTPNRRALPPTLSGEETLSFAVSFDDD